MPEKPVFWHFLEILSLVFSDFLHKDAHQQCLKHRRVRFSRKIFFRPKMPEICRKSPFLQIFIGLFPYISLFFHTKTIFITMPAINHSLIVNKNDLLQPELSKKRRNSRFSPEKRYFLNFSSCTFLYFLMKFCTLMQNGNV